MRVYVNEEEQVLDDGVHISELLSGIQLKSQKGIAVAINNTVIPRASWEDHALQDNDQVMIIQASQGG